MSKKYNEVPVKNNMVVEAETTEVAVDREKKQLTRVVDVNPKKVQRGLLTRLVSSIIGPEGLPGIGAYVNDEIVKPAIKNIIVDAVTSGINMVMYGEKPQGGRGHHTGYGRGPANYRPGTNYSQNYSQQKSYTPKYEEDGRRARPARYGVEDYIIEERFDAANVLTTLTDNADRYDSVSIADYYDLIGVASSFTDNSYGWTVDTIHRASITPVRGGYIIKFPPVEVI